ncbi:hypothetical protein [Rodentibacter caecimuris]|uniref:hypothetical protein n=1 Tax=Rodentibacter caecimuris TaxID=1796644 RepID=UPI001094582C|nr:MULTISPECIES: hypothetical protein [Pasteurellaceae]MCX2962444.1 hypothetical protein [Rodentibacter heylii]QIA75986.1 hypothetical protein FEE42_00685 [Rodentibacter heylii]TGY46284.1 hypothetical protein E5343_12410 [Pasteurella caecimuris]
MNKLQEKLIAIQQKKILEYWRENKLTSLFDYIDEIVVFPKSLEFYKLMNVDFIYSDLSISNVILRLEEDLGYESVYLFIYSYSGVNYPIESYPIFKVIRYSQDLLRFLLSLNDIYLIKISDLNFSKIFEISNLGNISELDVREVGVYNNC